MPEGVQELFMKLQLRQVDLKEVVLMLKFILNFLELRINKLDTISKIILGHDNTGFGPSWLVDTVSIRNRDTQDVFYFNVNKWFATDKGKKGLIARELTPGEQLREPTIVDYRISIITGDRIGASTNAKFFIELYGFTFTSIQLDEYF